MTRVVCLALVAFAMILQAAPQPVVRSGCLLYKDSQFILLDEESSEIVELHGQDLDLNLGNRVEVAGTVMPGTKPSVFLATTYLVVATVSPRAAGGCLTVASAFDARTAMPPTQPVKSAKQPKAKGKN